MICHGATLRPCVPVVALQLGAQCSLAAEAEVTHVVATDTTDKTRWARQQGKHVVSPQWLWASLLTWQRAEEARFPLVSGGRVGGGAAVAAALPRTEVDDVAVAVAAAGGGGKGPRAELE